MNTEVTATGSRQTIGTGSRLTERLLSSNGTIALIGLLTALLTAGYLLWFVLELRQQTATTAPMARAAAVLNSSLNRSIAALRGWTAYGDPGFITARQAVWQEEIEPSLAALRRLSLDSEAAEALERVDALGQLLRRLKLVQWKIQDIAQSPGNNPALAFYETRVRPLRADLQQAMLGAARAYRQQPASRLDNQFLASLITLYSELVESDLWLRDYILQGEEYLAENAISSQRAIEGSMAQVATGIAALPPGDIRSTLSWSLENVSAWQQLYQRAIAIRRATSGHMARDYMASEARPLLDEALSLSSALSVDQAVAMENRTSTLSTASYAVMGMALLMGVLSAGSLVFAFRLRGQVQNVLEKAQKLGQYELERLIGKGGMGEVYLANHAMLRRPTAIKLLRGISAQDARAQQRFQDEVRVACQLNHPNTIEIYDYGRTPAGIFYYAMEYLEGFSLEALVAASGPASPERVVHILLQACGSLAEAHAKGVLHRDIKPANIMLTRRGGVYDTVKVLDFGLARGLGTAPAGDAGAVEGTPLYLAPEAVLSSVSYTEQSDIYSLGSVAYFMLCGETIFPTGVLQETLARQLEEPVPFPSERLGKPLPEALEYLVMACLASDPAQRPTSAERLAAMLRACEIPAWTQEDARSWWQSYGEAACGISLPERGQIGPGSGQPKHGASPN